MANWIRVDEGDDVVASLRHIVACKVLIADDTRAWKWYALAVHSAIQGACVCHLTTTAAPIGAVTVKNAESWIKYFEVSRSNPQTIPPKTYLMALPDLLKAIRKPNSAGDGQVGSEIALRDSELNWLEKFHTRIRNQFTHFTPTSWSLEVSGLPDLAELGCRIVSDIAQRGWAFRNKDTAWHRELRFVIGSIGR